MAVIVMPPTTALKKLVGAFYALSGVFRYRAERIYVASMRMSVQGSKSSYTRGGEFGLYTQPNEQGQLVYNTDFTHDSDTNMNWSVANRDLFYNGGNPSAEIVPTNQLGHSFIVFPPKTVYKIDSLSIQGRTSAASTAFRFTFYDQHGHVLYTRGLTTVTTRQVWDVGIDL